MLMALVALADDFSVTGRLVNSEGETEPYATVRIYSLADTTTAVTLGTSSLDGTFNFQLPSAGDYRVNATAVGKKPVIREFSVSASEPVSALGDLLFEDHSTELAELTVVAQRPLVTKDIDRIGYDVQADEESKTSNVQDILRKVPMVSVEADGTIKVNGSSNFKIYKNGRPNNSFTQNAKDIFKAIPASTIKKIEVITDPGAREDAEGVGAILNIVTMQSAAIRGVMGNVGLGIDSKVGIPMPYVWLTSQVDKVTFSVNAGYFNARGRNFKQRQEEEYVYDDNGNHFNKSQEADWRNSRANGFFVSFETSYDIDSLNLLTAEFGGFKYATHTPTSSTSSMTSPTGNLIYSFDQHSLSGMSYLDFNGAFNYQRLTRRKNEMITLSYMISTNGNDLDSEDEYGNMVNPAFDYTGINAWSHERFIEHTGQLDWTHPINDNHTFDVGGKFIFRDNHATGERDYLESQINQLINTNYTHRMSIGAAYFDWRSKFGKATLRGGLRYEYSRLTSRDKTDAENNYSSNLNDWVPMVAVNYNFNDAHTLKLSYNTRISRPGINSLNPTVVTTPTSVSYGNPDLKSSLYHTIGLNYNIIKQRFNGDFSLSYRLSNTGVNSVSWVEDVNGVDVIHTTYRNVGRSRDLSFNGYFRWMISMKTNWMFNFSVSRSSLKYPADARNAEGISMSGWDGHLFTQFSQQLPGKITAGLAVFGWYSGFNGLYSRSVFTSANINHNISFSRNFLKDDRLTVKVYFTNPFGPYTVNRKTKYMNAGYTGYSNTIMPNRFQVSASVSFRFGSLNAYVKKASRAASNDDLESSRPSTGQGQGQGQ